MSEYRDLAANLSRAATWRSLNRAADNARILEDFLLGAEGSRVVAQSNGESETHYCENTKSTELFPKSACSCGQEDNWPDYENPYDGESGLLLDGHDDGSGLTPDKR